MTRTEKYRTVRYRYIEESIAWTLGLVLFGFVVGRKVK